MGWNYKLYYYEYNCADVVILSEFHLHGKFLDGDQKLSQYVYLLDNAKCPLKGFKISTATWNIWVFFSPQPQQQFFLIIFNLIRVNLQWGVSFRYIAKWFIYIFSFIYIYIFFFILHIFSSIGYYKILNIVSCAIQCILIVYFVYSRVYTLIPQF